MDRNLGLELAEREGVTALEFTQVISDPAILESIGPGWEYYLDRLVAAETGGDPSAIDFDRDCYPALSDHYSNFFLVDDNPTGSTYRSAESIRRTDPAARAETPQVGLFNRRSCEGRSCRPVARAGRGRRRPGFFNLPALKWTHSWQPSRSRSGIHKD